MTIMTNDNMLKSRRLAYLRKLYDGEDMNLVISEAKKLFDEYASGVAYNILVLAHKRQGRYQEAIKLYEKILKDNPRNTLFLYNLGNTYFQSGRRADAEKCYRRTLEIEPNEINPAVSLGNLLVSNAELDEALSIFEGLSKRLKSLTIEQLSDIYYRIADIYNRKGVSFINQAIEYYGLSDQPLSSANRLELIYKSRDKATFVREAKKINLQGESNPLLAAIQTHASIRYEIKDENLFCKNPLEYISHTELTPEEGFSEELIISLLQESKKNTLTPQSLINKGEQSAGNFFLSDSPGVLKIKQILTRHIAKYKDTYQNSDAGFIENWPKNSVLFGWIVRLRQGGSLDSHMHKQGWLSGSLYLKVPDGLHSTHGNIVFDLDGDSYPRGKNYYPKKEINVKTGDVVLFPSSIFHRTVPFDAQEDRVTLAFDLKPIHR